MLKYLVVSDSHNKHANLWSIIERVGKVDGMFFLGDVEDGFDYVQSMIDYPFYGVRGNCDYDSRLDDEQVVTVGNKKVFMTHGHLYFLDRGKDTLEKEARKNECDIVLYGHTHRPMVEQINGIWFANPGSVTQPRQFPRVPTYIIMEIDDKDEVHFSIAELEE